MGFPKWHVGLTLAGWGVGGSRRLLLLLLLLLLQLQLLQAKSVLQHQLLHLLLSLLLVQCSKGDLRVCRSWRQTRQQRLAHELWQAGALHHWRQVRCAAAARILHAAGCIEWAAPRACRVVED